MSKQFYTSIDLQQNELLNGVVHKSATAPLSPVEGQIYYNTSDDEIKVYNGTAWEAVGSELTVHADSSAFVSIVDGELHFHNLAITEVNVDVTETSLADFIANNYTAGNEFQEGDMIVLTAATDQSQRSWIHNGGSAGDANDFTRLQTDLNSTEIKGFFSAGTGLTYADGVFSITAGGVSATELADNAVTNAKMADNSVDTAEIVDEAVTEAKLSTALQTRINNTYKETFGDGATVTHTITHNLGTKDVMTQIYDVSTGKCIECDVTRTSVNEVTIAAYPAIETNDARILVKVIE